jgi:hypothetical protein
MNRHVCCGAILSALALLAAPAAAAAAERGYTVTSFDRIRVEGPYTVTVASGRSPAVRATGSPAALDAVVARVDGRTLVIQRNTSAWGGYPGQDHGPATIAVSTPGLVTASLAGSGRLDVDMMRSARIDLAVAGSGQIALARIETDRLGALVTGAGSLAIAGRAATAQLALNGSGRIDAEGLEAGDASVTANGSGDAIGGSPACTVRRLGSGNVTCGPKG